MLAGLGGLAGLLIVGACRIAPGGARRSADHAAQDAQTDRLRAVYAPLRDGHFAIIADFEAPIHETIFNLINASGTATTRVDPSGGRTVTGATALRVRLGGPSDAITASGESSSEWSLKRDWRDFDVLLMAIHTDATRDLRLELTAGRDETKRRYETSIEARSGWNLVALDLWDAAHAVSLEDVRELRIACPNGPYPADLALDDLILSRDRQWLLGERGNRGGLFVERQADRMNCGVGGLFEWSFLRGHIVGWYDLANDPNRLSNLAEGQAAGPLPGRLPAAPSADRSAASWSADGWAPLEGVEPSEQTLVEANRARVVVRCRAAATRSDDHAAASRSLMDCTYSLYTTGCAFVQAKVPVPAANSATNSTSSDLNSDVTWRWSWGRPAGWTQETLDAPSNDPGSKTQASFVLLTGRSVGGAQSRALLAAMVNRDQTAAQLSADGAGEVVFASQTVRRETNDATRTFDAVVLFGNDLAQLIQQVRCAASNSGITLTQGRYHSESEQTTTLPPALLQPGGCYELRDDGGAVRLMIDARLAPRWAPVVQVVDPQRRRCWIYVDHRLWSQWERLEDGSLLVQLPPVSGGKTAAECLFAGDSP